MKRTILFAIISACILSSCDILDKKPLGYISDSDVWSDLSLMDSYLAELYAQTPVFTNDATSTEWDKYSAIQVGMFYVNELSDECTYNWGLQNRGDIIRYKGGNWTIRGGLLEYWELPYKTIRNINIFLDNIKMANASDEYIKTRAAEARFLRVFNYFAMVKRYGGVPLITKVQELNDPKEELYPKRNSEQEIYDFILSEVDEIVKDLPEQIESAELGRISKYAAYALQSRAALYAGSIARYGKVQLDGLLGIPENMADSYYQKSYEASKAIINSGMYTLYDKEADKTENFKNIFLVKDNPEVILARKYNGVSDGGIAWKYDFAQSPKPQAWNAGNKNAPYLEMLESFEKIDGTPGTIDRQELTSGLYSIDELWGNRDPRFHATFYTEGTPWKGGTITFYNGLIKENGEIQSEGSYNGVLAQGDQSVDGRFGTGFGVMKYLDPDANNMEGIENSKTDYLVFRYGEIFLNLAEAAFELGKPGEALDAVNTIRNRSGMPSKTNIDREAIRAERKVELAFEGHRYWDLRRWRQAEMVLTGGRSGIRYYLDYATRKYKVGIIENVEISFGDGGTLPLFRPHYYYFPITTTRTGANPDLIENPGYN